MSSLTQFQTLPKRPRNTPGNDGYVLHRQPGFAEEQQCYRVTWQTRYEKDYSNSEPGPITHNVEMSFPNIKLGRNNYVLDLEAVDVKCEFPTASALKYDLETVCMVTISGLGDTHQVIDGKGCGVTSDTHMMLPSYSPFTPSATTTRLSPQGGNESISVHNIVKRAVYQKTTNTSNSLYEFGCVIPNDALTLSFTVTDDLITKEDYTSLTRLGSVFVDKTYHFVVRPNPSKRSYFENLM